MSVQTKRPSTRRTWTDAEDEWLRANAETPIEEAASRLGRTPGAVGQRRSKLGITPPPKGESRPWTDEDLGFLQDHDDWPSHRVGNEIGRSASAVRRMRGMLRRGYVRRLEPWSDEEIAILKELGETLVSSTLAEHLPGRSPQAIQMQRWKMGIRSEHGAKLAHQIGARPLIAKTCGTCGKLLQADWFSFRAAQRRWHTACRSCLSDETMERNKRAGRIRETPEENVVRQRAFRERMRQITEPQATRAGEEYVEADHKVLADPDLSILQKALKLGRTWGAVAVACSTNGYKSHVGLGESTDLWIIFNPNEVAA